MKHLFKSFGTYLENKIFFLVFLFEMFLNIFYKFFIKQFLVSKIKDLTILELSFNKQILVEVFPISPTM